MYVRAPCGSRAQQSCSTPARCPPCVLCSGWLWGRGDSVCRFRVYSCVLGRCTRSVGNAPLLIGCSAPDRVHRPVTGAAPPLGRCFWWWCGCLSGLWAPSCLAARETWQPLFARSRRLDIPESSGRCFRPGCPCGGWSKTLSAIPGANQSVGSAHWRVSAAIRWAGCAGGVFGLHLGAGVSREVGCNLRFVW